jgi:hypothetical protein
LKRYELLVRVASGVTSRTIIYASNAYEAKMLGEAQFGHGCILIGMKMNTHQLCLHAVVFSSATETA